MRNENNSKMPVTDFRKNENDAKFSRRTFIAGGAIALTGASFYSMRNFFNMESAPTVEVALPAGVDTTPTMSLELTPRFDPNFPQVILRRHPFPYRASLAITSDIDGTHPDKFDVLHRFLNTREKTPHGPGLGLDIADSCWMVVNNNLGDVIDPAGHRLPDQMSYWKKLDSKEESSAAKIRKYVNCGWIDSVHTYGDFNRKSDTDITFTRDFAKACIMEWQEKGLRFSTWIDHGNACNVQNFGSAGKSVPDYQQGDNPASPYYHTDLLIAYGGIRFVWNSSRAGSECLFSNPDLLYPITLRDGQHVWGFHRYSCKGLDSKNIPEFVWTPYNIGKLDMAVMLDQLIAEEGFTSMAQHLGSAYQMTALPDIALKPLNEIAKRYRENKLLVTRTSRLLQYNRVNNFLSFRVEKQTENLAIIIDSVKDPHLGEFKPTTDDLMGITFYTPQPGRTRIFLGDTPAPEGLIRRNGGDNTGRPSISFRWYTEDVNDYTR